MSEQHDPAAAAFEAGLLDYPDDLARWSAYSDYLSERGNPRGEFMRVQLALEDESLSAADRGALKKAEADLLEAHEREWLGTLAPLTVDAPREMTSGGRRYPIDPPVRHAFERGWLRRVEFDELRVDHARALAACPGARLLREVVIANMTYEDHYEPGPDVPEGTDRLVASLHALAACPSLTAVRAFRLGTPATLGEEYFYGGHFFGAAVHLVVRQMPRVERLELHAYDVDTATVFALPMPGLRHLSVLHVTGYPLELLAANPSVSKLESLQCQPGGRDPGACIRLEHLRAICRSPHLTKLTTLCLRLTDFGDAGVRELIDSGALARLRVLDLRGGCVTDLGARLLAASPHLRGLTFLNLGRNALTDAGVTLLQATGVNVHCGDQHADAVIDYEHHMPDYLYDGDGE